MGNPTNSDGLYEFEMLARDGLARIGTFRTKHGIINTPTLLPVINPNQLTISPKEMEQELKLQGYITNGFIIYNHSELRKRALDSGVHALLDTNLPIMTDSGTFQMYVYGEFGPKAGSNDSSARSDAPKPDPNEIVKFQSDIKSDIITILDMFTDPTILREEAEKRIEGTLNRASEAVSFKGKSALACTVQGGVYPELRKKAAMDLNSVDCEVYPIGGVVPLMENYRYADVAEAVIAAKSGLRPDRPVHLFGAGHPMIFPLAVMLGCDLFDSSSYAKYAKADRLMFPEGTRHLADMDESPCGCPTCTKFSIQELKDLGETERKVQIAWHNLHVSFNELKAVRQAVHEGTLREMVERRARAHPYLLDALKVIGHHVEFLEKHEPLSRRRFFYTGPESSSRPEVYRYKKRFFERYKLPRVRSLIIFEDKTGQKPYSAQFAAELESINASLQSHFIAISYFGPVPLELEDIYPLSQSVIPKELSKEERSRINKLMEHFAHRNREVMGIIWDGPETLEFMVGMNNDVHAPAGLDNSSTKAEHLPEMDILKVKAVADMQFGAGAGEILFNGELSFRKSKRTDRIRNVLLNDEHILSIRAGDGYFTLKIAGAQLLKAGMPKPALRVVVNPDSAEFNVQGKNVFAKFVINSDENLRPGDEVLVVDEQDKLVAVGRALMTKDEMKAFKVGIAVRVREGVKE